MRRQTDRFYAMDTNTGKYSAHKISRWRLDSQALDAYLEWASLTTEDEPEYRQSA